MLVTGVEGLYVWCRRITGGYRGVQVTNMTEAWRSGLAFCAIIHRFRPDLIDYDSLTESDCVANCSLAFRVAERELGIPALLDPRDMKDCPVIDKLSVLTYLAQFYHKFSGTAPHPTARSSRAPTSSSSETSSVVTSPCQPSRVAGTSSVVTSSSQSLRLPATSHPVTSPGCRVRGSSPVVPASPPAPRLPVTSPPLPTSILLPGAVTSSSSSDSSSASSVSSSDVSTDSGLEQSSSEASSSSCSRVSSVSPVSEFPSTPPQATHRGILKQRDRLARKKEYSRSFESLLDLPSPPSKRSESVGDQGSESSFKAAFKKFSTLSCSSSNIKASPASPPKPARQHLVRPMRSCSTQHSSSQTQGPLLVSQVTQTEESHLGGEEREDRRGRHRRQASTTVPRHQVAALQKGEREVLRAVASVPAGGPSVPNCDRSRQSRLLSGIASYGQLDKLLGRSIENIYCSSQVSARGPAGHFTRTHSTLV